MVKNACEILLIKPNHHQRLYYKNEALGINLVSFTDSMWKRNKGKWNQSLQVQLLSVV